MAFHAGSRIDAAVDLVLVQIIAAMRQRPLRGVLVFVAGLDLFLMRMAIRAKGFLVTDAARLGILGREKFVPRAEPFRMIQCSPAIGVTIAAHGHSLHLCGMHPFHAFIPRACVESEYHDQRA